MTTTTTEERKRPTFNQRRRILAAMDVAGMDAGDLADALGVHRKTISNWLHGKHPLKRGQLVAIASVTGVDLDWLDGTEGGAPVTRSVTLGERQHGRPHHLTVIHGKHRGPPAITGKFLREAG